MCKHRDHRLPRSPCIPNARNCEGNSGQKTNFLETRDDGGRMFETTLVIPTNISRRMGPVILAKVPCFYSPSVLQSTENE